MVEITLWRAVIGHFHLSCLSRLNSKRERHDKTARERCVTVTDVLCTWVCLLFLAPCVGCAVLIVQNAFYSPFLPNDNYHAMFVTSSLVDEDSMPLARRNVFSSTAEQLSLTLCVTASVLALRLKLSGDIEENPGPITDKTDKSAKTTDETACLHDSIKTLQESLQHKFDSILTAMQRQEDLLKQQGNALQKLGEEQEQMKATINNLCHDVNATKRGVQQNEETIRQMAFKQDHFTEKLEGLETEIDRLEGFSRRNNVKLLGVPEPVGDREDCVDTVKRVLNEYVPDNVWQPDVIERAHRLGRPNPHNPHPRPIIAKFQRWGDAIQLMKDRTARTNMEKDGLRVTQDLTKRQSMKLKKLREEGRTGYYVNGKLRVRDQRDMPPSHHTRPASRGEAPFPPRYNEGHSLSDADVRGPISNEERADDVTGRHLDASGSEQLAQRDDRPRTRSTSRQTQLTDMAWANTSDRASRVPATNTDN